MEKNIEWGPQEICVGLAKEIDDMLDIIDESFREQTEKLLKLHSLVTHSYEQVKYENEKISERLCKVGRRIDSILECDYLDSKKEPELNEIRMKWRNLND